MSVPVSTARAPKRRRLVLLAGLLTPLVLVSGSQALTLTLVPVKTNLYINEFNPTAQGDWFAWSQNSTAHPLKDNVYLQRTGQSRIKVNRTGVQGYAGGFNGSLFIYDEYTRESGNEIWKYNLDTGRHTRFGSRVNTRYSEFRPTMSGRWLLFGRYNWDKHTYRVILFNTVTKQSKILASGTEARPVKPGQLNGRYATFERRTITSNEIYRYDVLGAVTSHIPRPASVAFQYNPSVARDGAVYYTRSGDGCGVAVQLARYPIGGPAEVLKDLPANVDTGWGYIDDRADGGRDIYFPAVACRRDTRMQWDIYKIVDSYTLTVAKAGTGTGTVTSSPTGVNCGADCSEVYPRATTVTLTATADSGSHIAAWSIPACGTDTTCPMKVTSNATVTVTFEPDAP
jgi:hypothetical protein